jgi:hypothetical protein
MPVRTPVYWRAIVFSAVTLGCCIGAGPSFLGVTPAEAKAFYTRKRVNGHWITGRFPKRHATAARPALEGKARPVPAPVVTSTAALPVAAPLTKSPALDSRPEPAAAPPVAAPAAPIGSPTEEQRLQGLREALQARASRLVTTGSTGAGAPPAPQPQNGQPLATSSIGESKAAAPPPPREARSVSLDFETGIKTTLFSDGTTLKERFDIEALKALASPSAAKPPQ